MVKTILLANGKEFDYEEEVKTEYKHQKAFKLTDGRRLTIDKSQIIGELR